MARKRPTKKTLPLSTCEVALQKKDGLCGRPATHLAIFWSEYQEDPAMWHCLFMCSLHMTWEKKNVDRAVRTFPLSSMDYAFTPSHIEVPKYVDSESSDRPGSHPQGAEAACSPEVSE